MASVYGRDPPSSRPLPFPAARSDAPIEPGFRHREEARKRAVSLVENFFTRNFQGLVSELSDTATVLWPDGSLAAFPSRTIVEELSRRPGTARTPRIPVVRTYSGPELRNFLPRTMPEALEAVLGQGNIFAVLDLHVGQDKLRICVATGMGHDGVWRARSLPIPAFDDAHVRGRGPSMDEDEAVNLSDRTIRHSLLGHGPALASLQSSWMPRLVIGQEVTTADELISKSATGPAPLARADTAFLGTKLLGADPEKLLPMAVVQNVKRSCESWWHLPFERLKTKVCATELGILDPSSLTIGKRETWRTLLLAMEVKLPDERFVERYKLAGVFSAGD